MHQKLKELCDSAIKRYPPKLSPTGEVLETYCNLGLAEIGKAVGCTEIAGMRANKIHDHALSHPDRFIEVNGLTAHGLAMRGNFVFASKKAPVHGHVACVYPDAMSYSGSLKRNVPVLANIGKENGVMASSRCFPVADGECSYFFWVRGV
jgi:hypothetical protein